MVLVSPGVGVGATNTSSLTGPLRIHTETHTHKHIFIIQGIKLMYFQDVFQVIYYLGFC